MVDRDATLKQAEKLLRQGKLEGAIAEYVRLVQDQPRDWNSINALGDLYIRAGHVDRAVAQFTQVADFMFAEGFMPKASALYKKALKVKPDHEHTLLRLSDIAAGQGLLLDARNYLRQLGRQRRDRGDSRGAAEILVRLGTLDEADGEARLAAARAAQALGDTAQALALFKSATETLANEGRQREAFEALSEAAALDPADPALRRQLARDAVASGQLDRAHTFLTTESAGDDPDLLLALGRMELAAGHEAEARSAFTRMIARAPERVAVLLDLGAELARGGSLTGAFICAEVLVDDALLAGDWDRALDALQALLQHGPHIPALVKMVELAVDAGRETVMEDAEARLADAYIDGGRAEEARVIAEDLVARNPQSEVHADRLRRALALLGVDDADAIIARYREPADDLGEPLTFDDASFGIDPGREVDAPRIGAAQDVEADRQVGLKGSLEADLHVGPTGGVEADLQVGPGRDREPSSTAAVPQELAKQDPGDRHEDGDAIVLDRLEVDLSEALAGLGAGAPVLPPPAAPPESPDPPRDLESVFEDMRTRVARQQPEGDGREEYERGLQQLEHGQVAEAIASLRAAARRPLYRFRAAVRLGRLQIARGEVSDGIEWLERAAEAPAPSPDEGWAVLYDLAQALERIGENARALAVLLEVESDAGSYRDVRGRIELLSRAQAGKA